VLVVATERQSLCSFSELKLPSEGAHHRSSGRDHGPTAARNACGSYFCGLTLTPDPLSRMISSFSDLPQCDLHIAFIGIVIGIQEVPVSQFGRLK
jgi:hypothetical protein